MFLVVSFVAISLLSLFAEATGVGDNSRYCKASENADKIIIDFSLSPIDIGFPVQVHAVEGEVKVHSFNQMRVLKEIYSEKFNLSFWTIEANQGVRGLSDDGYASLIYTVNKLELCQFDTLSKKEKILITSYFPTYNDETLSVYIASDSRYIIAVNDADDSSFSIVYKTPNQNLVVRGDIERR